MPEWQQEAFQNVALPFAQNILEGSYTPYTGQLTANVPQTSTQAQQYYETVGGIANMTPEQYAQRIQSNMNPYQDQVIDAALARAARERAIAQTGEMADITRAGAFGNERRGVFEGERQAAYEIGRDQMVADLMRQGYDQAQAATMAQLGQEQSAALAAAGGYMQLGGLQQATEQARLDALYDQFLRQQQDPYQRLGAYTGTLSGIPVMGSTTTSQKPGIFDYLTLGATVASSDRRLKKNIQHIDTIDGVKFYTWEWNEIADQIGVSGDRNVGVIAQELEAIYPELVIEGSDGYLRVNYGGLAAKLQEAA
jgi:hypothetical protein